MQNLTLKQLRIVLEITKTGKIASSAKNLGVTPPAVTLQLKQLEDSLGLTLFERRKDGLRPTDAGRVVLETAERIEASLRDCADSLDAMKGLTAGKVSVGVVSTAKYFAPRALGAFASEHPAIDLSLSINNRAEILAGLAEMQWDVTIMGRPPTDIDLEQHIIGDHPHVFIAPLYHRLIARRKISIAAIAREALIVREPGSGTRLLMERLFAKADANPNVVMEIDSNETIKQAVMAGLGIAFISAHTIASELETRRLAVLPVTGLPITRKWFVVRHAGKPVMPAAENLWQFLVSQSQRYLPFSNRSAALRSKRVDGHFQE